MEETTTRGNTVMIVSAYQALAIYRSTYLTFYGREVYSVQLVQRHGEVWRMKSGPGAVGPRRPRPGWDKWPTVTTSSLTANTTDPVHGTGRPFVV